MPLTSPPPRVRRLVALATHALLVTLSLTVPAGAQEEDRADDVIVVEGERPVTVRELRNQATAITPLAGWRDQPMPRFHQVLCAGVWGLSVDSARYVIDRIYYNAGLIGLPVSDEEGCAANVILVLTDDAEAEFAAMRRENHPLVRGLDLWERKRIERRDDGPVVVFNAISKVSNSGVLPMGDPPVVETTMMSRTMTSSYNQIEVSVVMINREAVRDIDAVALADYVTMRALARTRQPVGEVAVGTILSLFDPEANGPHELSAFDKAYLGGLYDNPESLQLRRAMGRIGTRLRHELTSERQN